MGGYLLCSTGHVQLRRDSIKCSCGAANQPSATARDVGTRKMKSRRIVGDRREIASDYRASSEDEDGRSTDDADVVRATVVVASRFRVCFTPTTVPAATAAPSTAPPSPASSSSSSPQTRRT